MLNTVRAVWRGWESDATVTGRWNFHSFTPPSLVPGADRVYKMLHDSTMSKLFCSHRAQPVSLRTSL